MAGAFNLSRYRKENEMIWRCLFCWRWNNDRMCCCGKSEKDSELRFLQIQAEKDERLDRNGGGLGDRF